MKTVWTNMVLMAVAVVFSATAGFAETVPGRAAIPAPPLALPTADIFGETNRHVIIAQGTVEIYQGHANTVLMPDGRTMFCVWTLNHGWGDPFLKRSDDMGLSWREVPMLTDWSLWCKANSAWRKGSTLGSQARGWLPMIHHLTDGQGKNRLVIFDRGANFHLIQSVSEDGGKTWSPMRPNGLRGIEPSMNIIPARPWDLPVTRWEICLCDAHSGRIPVADDATRTRLDEHQRDQRP